MPTGTELYTGSLADTGTASANNNSVSSKPALYIEHDGPGNLEVTVTTRTRAAAGVEKTETLWILGSAAIPEPIYPAIFDFPFTEFDIDLLSHGACNNIVVDVCEA